MKIICVSYGLLLTVTAFAARGGGGGGGSPLYGYKGICAAPRGRAVSRFGHKQGIDFGHFGHKEVMVFSL